MNVNEIDLIAYGVDDNLHLLALNNRSYVFSLILIVIATEDVYMRVCICVCIERYGDESTRHIHTHTHMHSRPAVCEQM